jgi:hypothetical protein
MPMTMERALTDAFLQQFHRSTGCASAGLAPGALEVLLSHEWQNWSNLDPSTNLPGMRDDAVLRRITEPPRHQARPRDGPSCHRIGGAR